MLFLSKSHNASAFSFILQTIDTFESFLFLAGRFKAKLQSISTIAVSTAMQAMANMTVIAPADGAESANAVTACVDHTGTGAS